MKKLDNLLLLTTGKYTPISLGGDLNINFYVDTVDEQLLLNSWTELTLEDCSFSDHLSLILDVFEGTAANTSIKYRMRRIFSEETIKLSGNI